MKRRRKFSHLLSMSGLHHFVYRPREAFRRYVREILFLDSEARRVQVLMPETTPTLMLQQSGSSTLGGGKLSCATVSGLQSASRTVEVFSNSAIAIVRFTEIGAATIIRDPMHSLYDSSIAMDDLLRHSDVDCVLNSLADSKGVSERTVAVEHFLGAYIRRTLPPNPQIEVATRLIRRTGGQVSTDKLTSLLQTNHSTLERRFKTSVGATPKALSRLARLQNVCRLWDLGQSLTQITYEAGFSDQSHLTHEFRRLVASAPRISSLGRLPETCQLFTSSSMSLSGIFDLRPTIKRKCEAVKYGASGKNVDRKGICMAECHYPFSPVYGSGVSYG